MQHPTTSGDLAALEDRLGKLAEASAATGNSPSTQLAGHWAELRSIARQWTQLQDVVQAMTDISQ